MAKRLVYAATVLLLLAISWLMNQGAEPVGAWQAPSAAQLEQFRSEPGLRIKASQLAQLKSAAVERVVDGDTLELNINGLKTKVRLLNINTPETVDPRRPIQEYGREASDFVKRALPRGVKVYYRFDVEKQDKYGRLLVHVYQEDGTWLNALLVRAGYAQLATYPPNVAAAPFFKELQAKARAEGVGLWQIPPAGHNK